MIESLDTPYIHGECCVEKIVFRSIAEGMQIIASIADK